MGGGSGGGVPSSAISDVLAQAEERLRRMAAEASHILVACEEVDRAELNALVQQLGSIAGVKLTVISPPMPVAIDNSVAGANFVVVFTAHASEMQFLDHVVEACLLAKKAGMHVKRSSASRIPSRVTAYRWRSISWEQFIQFIARVP